MSAAVLLDAELAAADAEAEEIRLKHNLTFDQLDEDDEDGDEEAQAQASPSNAEGDNDSVENGANLDEAEKEAEADDQPSAEDIQVLGLIYESACNRVTMPTCRCDQEARGLHARLVELEAALEEAAAAEDFEKIGRAQ